MKRGFYEIVNNLKNSIADYKYYVDFEKVYKNAEKLKVELNILNSLIMSSDIKNDFIKLYNEYPQVLKTIPMLLAVRGYEIKVVDAELIKFNFNNFIQPLDKYIEFIYKNELFEFKLNEIIKYLKN